MNDKIKSEYNYIIYAMKIAFLEIRMANSLETAYAYADIFHNAPGMILAKIIPSEIEAQILKRASDYGLQKDISSAFSAARKNVKKVIP